MKTGSVSGQPSRREQRRNQQQEEDSKLLRRGVIPAEPPVEPAKLPPGRYRDESDVDPGQYCLIEDQGVQIEPPPQADLLSHSIKVRNRAELIWLPQDFQHEQEIRPTLIQDIDKKGRLYLAQTSPPVLKSQAGSPVEITFLSRYNDVPGGRWLRVGYRTQVEQVIPSHRLSATMREPVIVVPGPRELKPTTVRTSFRVSPPPDLDFRLLSWPDLAELGLVDISTGGAQFHHSNRWAYNPGYRMHLCVASGKIKIYMAGKVVRTGQVRARRGWMRGMTSVKFENMDQPEKRRLFKLLHATYRHCLAKRSGVLPSPEEAS